jgi:hypothetical protein
MQKIIHYYIPTRFSSQIPTTLTAFTWGSCGLVWGAVDGSVFGRTQELLCCCWGDFYHHLGVVLSIPETQIIQLSPEKGRIE